MRQNRSSSLGTKFFFLLKPSSMALCGAFCTAAFLSACGGGSGGSDTTPTTADSGLDCTLSSIQNGFKPDTNTTIVEVRQLKKGDKVLPVDTTTPIAMANDVCLVKLLVGPGYTSEPTTAKSYSKGIGMEIWLPAKGVWNERIRNYGGGGWVGGNHRNPTQLDANGNIIKIGTKNAGLASVNMGYAQGTHDAGQEWYQEPSFILKVDGTINETLMHDFWYRSQYEQAIKAKALVKAYYAKEQKYAYYDGQSQGGRQGMKLFQDYPELYDGYLIAAPAGNILKFATTGIYPQVVMKTDLGFNAKDNPTATAAFDKKLAAVNALAVQSCDKEGLGFLIDPFACSYNPAQKAQALCAGVTGDGVTGTSTDPNCVSSLTEANAINKIFYGPTIDGSFEPNQSYESRSGLYLGTKQLFWSKPFGTSYSVTAPGGADYLALVNQDTAYGSTFAGSYDGFDTTKAFINPMTTERDKWTQLTYASMTNSMIKGMSLNEWLGNPNTDKTDLSRARDLNRKIVMYGGLADNSIPAANWINYYTRVASGMNGTTEVQKFFRLYMIPGMAHSSSGASTSLVAPVAPYAGYPGNTTVPLPMLPGAKNPTPTEDTDQMFTALKNWVEQGSAPNAIVIASSDKSVSYPICVYPKKITWDGVNSSKLPSSYSCK